VITGDMAVWQEGRAESQARLAALSSNSAHITGTSLGHSIALERPALVAAAVAAVIAAVNGGPLDVTEVRRLAADPRAMPQ
jgi:phage tail sheath gpL-like